MSTRIFRSRFFFFWSVVLLCVSAIRVQAQQPVPDSGQHYWWKGGYPRRPKQNPEARVLPLIRVVGNKLVNALGDTILFRGVSIADPDKISAQGHWNRLLFEHVRKMGAMIVRIPVHPISWHERGADRYLPLLDSAVDWCTGLGMYVDIDWHSIGNLEMELFQAPMYNTTKRETYTFWRTMARHFRNNNTVAFFELFNEPTSYRGQLGTVSWTAWKTINENIIHLIRAFDTQTIPLVAGFDWAYDLTPLREAPINASGIAYVTHPYPNKRTPPWEPKWEEDFGFAASNYPVIATEIGFAARPGEPAGPDDYGDHIISYLESRGIGWIAWVYDPDWGPPLIKSWDSFALTGAGEFFKKAMQEKNRK
ncbi:MAG TPA: cellulase family glycosylhydrolase [Chitinophagaceae bacterium]|nr:cellulase family glycosylhydrolase [Chitinophagaceae bacterium]